MMPRVLESVTKIQHGDLTIRVWREEFGWKAGTQQTTRDEILAQIDTHWETKAILDAICELPRISAVEILTKDGQGCILYPEWP